MHQDGKARPGVVLAHGFTETKNQKYIVELSTLLYQNGWHVLAIDLRGHGESRSLSPALITSGWKEADDILAGAKLLREESKPTSVAVLGFSIGGRSAVKAMVKDQGQLLQVGMGLGAPIGEPAPVLPPDPQVPPTPIDRYFLGFLGAASFYEYNERAAKSYEMISRRGGKATQASKTPEERSAAARKAARARWGAKKKNPKS
jgi:alpha-beta hydrolase superfamily lysophospholipase